MSEHTPGPWAKRRAANPVDGGIDYAIVDVEGKIIAEAFEVVGVGETRDAEANATLIEAAPDLLVALDDLLDIFTADEANLYVAEIQAAKAAIAKATKP